MLGQPGRGIPDGIGQRRQLARLHEVPGGLRCHAGREQQQQPARHGKQVTRRDDHEAAIERPADRHAAREPERAAGPELRGIGAAGRDAIEEEHDLGTLAQHREADDHEQHGQRSGAAGDVAADGRHLAREVGAVALHPDVVPAEHRRRRQQDTGVEHLLAEALERGGDPFGEAGDDERADDAERDAAGDPGAPARHGARRGEHDPDEERRLENLAQDDDRGCDHGTASSQPRAVFALNSPKYS